MQKHGILIVGLGTPNSLDTKDVKDFIKKFLSDKRVIKKQGFAWKMILHGIILRKRPKKSAQRYKRIWTDQGLPILVHAKTQKAHLQALMPNCVVDFAMTYSNPSIHETLDKMIAQNITHLTVVPLFPQYSSTTIDSIFDSIVDYGFFACNKVCPKKKCASSGASLEQAGAALRINMLSLDFPEKTVRLRFISSFYNNPMYIEYFANKIKNAADANGADGVLFSFHGLPEQYVQDGDPYPKQCSDTAHLIMQAADVNIPFFLGYQSKFGRGKWLEPASNNLAQDLPKKGIKNLLVLAPGFVADNLETILEIQEEMAEIFMQSGGDKFTYIPTFNDDIALAHIVHSIVDTTTP